MIGLNDICFGYEDDNIFINNLNFNLTEGEKIGIVGTNGSGKTTLFYLIMGLLKPLSGRIEILEKSRTQEKDFIEVRREVGMLFQNPDNQLFLPTVGEDIAFGPLNLGKTLKETEVIVDETCEILGLRKFQDRISYKLSWGEKKLVSLATVISMKPKILLFDEPTLGLDTDITERIIDYLNKHIKTCVIISHDDCFLKEIVDKIYLLKDGKLHKLGKNIMRKGCLTEETP